MKIWHIYRNGVQLYHTSSKLVAEEVIKMLSGHDIRVSAYHEKWYFKCVSYKGTMFEARFECIKNGGLNV